MVLSDISIRRPVFATVINLVVLLIGIIAYDRLAVRLIPNVDTPVVTVSTNYPGASAQVIESQVTQPIEDALSGVEGIEFMSSVSREQSSQVTLRFRLDRDADAAASDVRLVLLCRHEAFGGPGEIAPVEQQLVRPFTALGIAVTPGSAADVEHWADASYLRQTYGGSEGQALLMLCEVTTTSRPVLERALIAVLSSGVARLVDANSGELLTTVSYSPDAAGDSPAVGSAEKMGSLLDRSLSNLATKLAGLVLEEL